MKYPGPPPPGMLASHWRFMLAVDDMIYVAAQRMRHARWRLAPPRRGVGRTVRPGPETPLWNLLVKRALPYLGKRGSKVQLARFLGLPKQRVQDCLRARNAAFDAERTLRLLCWVEARERGLNLSQQTGPRVT